VDSVDEKGMTPLMLAVNLNHTAIARYLVESGANINAQMVNGYTPLLLACDGGNIELVAYFLSRRMIFVNYSIGTVWFLAHSLANCDVALTTTETRSNVLMYLCSWPNTISEELRNYLVCNVLRLNRTPAFINAQSVEGMLRAFEVTLT
jgi:ankyrin repeat protein